MRLTVLDDDPGERITPDASESRFISMMLR
jgi:hypothetical protein